MKTKWFAIAALTAGLAVPAGMTARAHAAALPAGTGLYQDRPWDQAPDEYRDVQRQGFHDGIEAARSDWDRHSHRDADDHDRYKHPPVAREFHGDYRDGFKHGYDMAVRHMRDEHRDHDDHPY